MNSSQSQPSAGSAPYVVLAAIDFATTGDEAFEEALRIVTARTDASLHVVHVITDVSQHARAGRDFDQTASRLEDVPTQLRRYIVQKYAALSKSVGPSLVVHARLGSPTDAILQVAIDISADLIVVGTHGRHGIAKLVLGSVAQQLVERAHCPVLVAHEKNYDGLKRSETVEPLCPDCARTREITNGATMWCDYHSRPQVRPHGYSYTEVFPVGGHDPGIIPPGNSQT